MKSRRTALALSGTLAAGVAVASVLAAAPAQADTQKHKDKKGDVTLLNTQKVNTKTLDITKYQNTYENGALTLSTTVVALAEKGWDLEWTVKGGGNVTGGFLFATGDGLQGAFFDTEGNQCEGATPSIEGDTVTFTVPADCLGTPDSVKIINYSIKQKGKKHILVDDANQGKLTNKSKPKFGEKLDYTAPL